MTTHTPLIQQYLDIKAKHPDSILFFRVGDFYEMFFDDAREGSELLGLTLTTRNNGAAANVPLAGVPAKAVNDYIPRLVREGRRVAICEQVEDPSEAEGIVRREVVETVTPGTVLDESLLSATRNNFVAAIAGEGPFGVVAVDLSTGEFDVVEVPSGALADELARLEPAEILWPASAHDPPAGSWTVTRREAWRFEPQVAAETLCSHFGVASIEGFDLSVEADPHLVSAAGAVLSYLQDVRPAGISHLRHPRVDRGGRTMHLDAMTRRNLELVEPIRGTGSGTLMRVLDRTRTAMGARLLRSRILQPLLDLPEIEARLEAVSELVDQRRRRDALREALGGVRDLERLSARLATGRIAPRELLSLAASLAALPAVENAVVDAASPRLAALARDLDPLADVREAIEAAIAEDTPPSFGSGGVIRSGHSEELDELRRSRDGAIEWIAALQQTERVRTGIQSLKIGFNRVFGYYIEVTKSKLAKVPDTYTRKQTLANAERYFTPELKEWEEKVTAADEGIAELEAELYGALRRRLLDHVGRVQGTAERIAELDVLASLAEVAARNDYCRPEVSEAFELEICGGRHPVVEQLLNREEFIPNDVRLDRDMFIMVLTGPNMAGKSTVLRQVGLTVLMAQIGSFVPADSARIGIADRVFTRVGASDSLATGQSTFMVEMTETATILNSATERSLILLDEIGRGTSTYDGLSIAWAVTEYVHERLGARAVCATHYHELVELADLLPGVGAFNVAVRESAGQVVFLRRLEPGGCDRSYGVHVAQLAGLPSEVVERANQILWELEGGATDGGTRLSHLSSGARGQLSLFERSHSAALDYLEQLDPEQLTPIEALNALDRLRALRQLEGHGSGERSQ